MQTRRNGHRQWLRRAFGDLRRLSRRCCLRRLQSLRFTLLGLLPRLRSKVLLLANLLIPSLNFPSLSLLKVLLASVFFLPFLLRFLLARLSLSFLLPLAVLLLPLCAFGLFP